MVTVLGCTSFTGLQLLPTYVVVKARGQAKHKHALLLNAFFWSIYFILCRFSEDSNYAGFFSHHVTS